MSTMERQFRYFIQIVLQDRINGATVTVQFGKARDTHRRFDTDHNGYHITFTIDSVYMHNPEEVAHIWGGLKKWVDGWNEVVEHGTPEDWAESEIVSQRFNEWEQPVEGDSDD